MRRTILFSLLTTMALAPDSLFAMSGKELKDAKKGGKEEKVQGPAKARKMKPGSSVDDIEVGKKKLKSPRAVPHQNDRLQDDDADDVLWDTEFLVRSTIPVYRGTLVYTKF